MPFLPSLSEIIATAFQKNNVLINCTPPSGIYGPSMVPWNPGDSVSEPMPPKTKQELEGGDDPLPSPPKDPEYDVFDPKNWGV